MGKYLSKTTVRYGLDVKKVLLINVREITEQPPYFYSKIHQRDALKDVIFPTSLYPSPFRGALKDQNLFCVLEWYVNTMDFVLDVVRVAFGVSRARHIGVETG